MVDGFQNDRRDSRGRASDSFASGVKSLVDSMVRRLTGGGH